MILPLCVPAYKHSKQVYLANFFLLSFTDRGVILCFSLKYQFEQTYMVQLAFRLRIGKCGLLTSELVSTYQRGVEWEAQAYDVSTKSPHLPWWIRKRGGVELQQKIIHGLSELRFLPTVFCSLTSCASANTRTRLNSNIMLLFADHSSIRTSTGEAKEKR